MDPALSAAQMRSWDRYVIDQLGVPGAVLMDQAGRAVAEQALAMLEASEGERAWIFCGPGNNGGDGFVAARYLLAAGVGVAVFSARPIDALGPDPATFARAAERLGVPILPLEDSSLDAELAPGDLLIDALLGTGTSRPVEGELLEALHRLADLADRGLKVLAVDLPTGLCADTGAPLGGVVGADRTVTFGPLKRGQLQEPGASLCGELIEADIGLPPGLVEHTHQVVEILDEGVIEALPARLPEAHKGDFGHLLVVAGEPARPGAATLACQSGLRAGAGLVTLAARPGTHLATFAQAPEVMGAELAPGGPLEASDLEALVAAAAGAAALVIGPALSPGPGLRAVVEGLGALELPQVLDAGALSAFAGAPEALAGAAGPRVLTPHPGEAARLLGVLSEEIQRDRYEAAWELAERAEAVVVLKGAKTVIALPSGPRYVCPIGGPELATAGTGDVLAGLIGALLAQGCAPEEAAALGVYLHARAGAAAAEGRGVAGVVARDLVEAFGPLLKGWSR